MNARPRVESPQQKRSNSELFGMGRLQIVAFGGRSQPRRMVSGVDAGAKALTESSGRGTALVGLLGGSIILEDRLSSAGPSSSRRRDYRIVATIKVSTLEKELKEAAAEGFRAIDAGQMRVVMEREEGAPAPPLEYRVVSSASAGKLEHQLQAAGAEGFQIAVVPESKDEGVLVLQRTPGTSERFDYRLASLEKGTANELLLQAEAAGYRMVAFLSRFAIFGRPLSKN
jgi:hypothetical protein